jgi:hypothetical protein
MPEFILGIFLFGEFMIVLSLCKRLCPDKIPDNLGEYLGDGADGEVFSVNGDPSRVIKLGIMYERPHHGLLKGYQQIQKVLDFVIDTKPDAFARVYEHGYIGTYSRNVEFLRSKKQDFVIYFYTMEKLEKISDDEKRVFHSILSHEDRGMKKNFSTEKIQEMLEGMAHGLDFSAENVRLFCDNIRKTPAHHLDIHVRNIMKNESGEFKLIDLDRVSLEDDNE